MIKSSNYIEIDGTVYVLDMDILSAYLYFNDNEKIIEKTKNEQWAASDERGKNELFLVSKDITETSSARKDEYAPFRGDIIKMLFSLVMYPIVDDNGEAITLKTLDDNMTVGQTIAFNTFLNEGIIKEISNNETDNEE